MPPIAVMDVVALNKLVNVRHLSLSTNSIEKMTPLSALRNLEILSLGRNNIKKIAGPEDVGATLLELWLSYNQISNLDGLQPCQKLQILYMSNNKIADAGELSKLEANKDLVKVNFKYNPFYASMSMREARLLIAE